MGFQTQVRKGLSSMWQVYRKELLELVRDRKTLMFVVALPVLLFPILFLVVAFLMSNVTQDAQKQIHNYTVIGADNAPEFTQALFYHQHFKYVSVNEFPSLKSMVVKPDNNVIHGELDPELKRLTAEVIASKKVDIVIVIPDKIVTESFIQQQRWFAVFNDASALNFMYSRLNELSDKYAHSLRTELLNTYSVPHEEHEVIQQPIVWQQVDVADARENIGEKLGGLIPYLLIPLCLVGATYPAIDLGAGEKERNTLETLLLTPMPRYSVVLGKFLTIVTTAIASALITVSSFLFWSVSFVSLAELPFLDDITQSISFIDLLLILALLLPLAAVFASILLVISIYARSFKEAQNYMGPLSFLVMLPVISATLPNMKLTWTTAAIPITNIALAIKEILKGTVDYGFVGAIFISTAIFAGLALWFCTYWFNREDVLFR